MSVCDEVNSGYYPLVTSRSSRVRVGPLKGVLLGFDAVVNPLAALFPRAKRSRPPQLVPEQPSLLGSNGCSICIEPAHRAEPPS